MPDDGHVSGSASNMSDVVYVLILVIICGPDHNKRLCERSKQVNITVILLFAVKLRLFGSEGNQDTHFARALVRFTHTHTHTHTQHLVGLEKHHDA